MPFASSSCPDLRELPQARISRPTRRVLSAIRLHTLGFGPTFSPHILCYTVVVCSTGCDTGRPQIHRAKGDEAVHCPFCRHPDSRVVDSREHDDGAAIRRRRACPECGRRFTTVETAALTVLKRSGVSEPFSRAKVADGVRKACEGRPVSEDALALLAQRVEETVRGNGCAEVAAHEIGLAILAPLRDLDEVSYMRFASVYRSF